jgi:hypothetical protein
MFDHARLRLTPATSSRAICSGLAEVNREWRCADEIRGICL